MGIERNIERIADALEALVKIATGGGEQQSHGKGASINMTAEVPGSAPVAANEETPAVETPRQEKKAAAPAKKAAEKKDAPEKIIEATNAEEAQARAEQKMPIMLEEVRKAVHAYAQKEGNPAARELMKVYGNGAAGLNSIPPTHFKAVYLAAMGVDVEVPE